MISIADIDEVEAMAPLSVQLENGRLIIYLDQAGAIEARLTAIVANVEDSAGILRTAYRWEKVQPGPGGTFVLADGNIRGYVASDTPPTWPAFCVGGASAVGDVVRLYPGSRDNRTDLTENYGVEWWFWPPYPGSLAVDVEGPFSTQINPTSHMTFGPYNAWTLEDLTGGWARLRLNFAALGQIGIISTEPQYLGGGMKNVFELGISPFAFMTDPDNATTAQVALIHPPPDVGEYYLFYQDLCLVRDWRTGSDTHAFEKATLNCGPIIKLDGSAIHGGGGAWVGCGTTNVSNLRLEVYDGSLPGTAWANPAQLVTSLYGQVTSSGIMDGGGIAASVFSLWFGGMQHIGSSGQFPTNGFIGGFVPGSNWTTGGMTSGSDEFSDESPWRSRGDIFLSDKHVRVTTQYKLRQTLNPGGSLTNESANGCIYTGQTAVIGGHAWEGTGMGFVGGIYVGGAPTFGGYLGSGDGSGGGNGGSTMTGILSPTQGGTGLNLGSVTAGALLVTGQTGAPMQVLASVRTGINGKLQFGVDANTWLEYDMSTYP